MKINPTEDILFILGYTIAIGLLFFALGGAVAIAFTTDPFTF
jgi:hypothetical protein